MARNFWISHVAPGDRIIHHGESLDVLYFIARGSLEVKQGETVVGLLGKEEIKKVFLHCGTHLIFNCSVLMRSPRTPKSPPIVVD